MPYLLNQVLTAVATPPIADVHRWLEGRRSSHALLDVAQAVPVEPPPLPLRQHIARLIERDGQHRYTPIRGLPALTAALAEHMSECYGAPISDTSVVITAGCNQAFCTAMNALLAPGDEVLLPVPYYFNHQMWLEMVRADIKYVPFSPLTGGIPPLEVFARLLSARTRAIVVVSPNNPTGAVYPSELLEGLYNLARDNGIALVLDETYKDFHPEAGAPHGLFARADWPDVLVQIFSFSKSYSLTGYRLGSLIAGPDLVEQLTKVQDCISICAPRIAQEAALYALQHLHGFVAERRAEMGERIDALRAAFAVAGGSARAGRFSLECAGAWFAYVAHGSSMDGYEAARRLARNFGVLCVPGQMFGPGQEAYLRFAFANLCAGEMPLLVERLGQFQESM